MSTCSDTTTCRQTPLSTKLNELYQQNLKRAEQTPSAADVADNKSASEISAGSAPSKDTVTLSPEALALSKADAEGSTVKDADDAKSRAETQQAQQAQAGANAATQQNLIQARKLEELIATANGK